MKYLTYFLVFIMCASWGQADPVPNTLDDLTVNINIDNKRSHKRKPATNYAPPEDYEGNGNEEDYEGIRWRADGRCGTQFPLATGEPTQCNPNTKSPCCSDENAWCGYSVHHCDCQTCVNYAGGQSRVAPGSPRAGCHLQGICANKKAKLDYSQRQYDTYGCISLNACTSKYECIQRAVKLHKFCDNSMEQPFNAIFVDNGVETVYPHPKGTSGAVQAPVINPEVPPVQVPVINPEVPPVQVPVINPELPPVQVPGTSGAVQVPDTSDAVQIPECANAARIEYIPCLCGGLTCGAGGRCINNECSAACATEDKIADSSCLCGFTTCDVGSICIHKHCVTNSRIIGALGGSRMFVPSTVQLLGYVAETADRMKCCRKCQTSENWKETTMIAWYKGQNLCSCYMRLKEKQPITFYNTDLYADGCDGCYLKGNCANNRRDYEKMTYDEFGCQNKHACSDKTACKERAKYIHTFCGNTFEQKFESIFVEYNTGIETVNSFP